MTTSIPLTELGGDNWRRDQWGRYLILPPGGNKPIGYVRATTVASTLDGGGGLAPWKAAMAAQGLIMRRGLRAQWEALMAETGGDPWYASDATKKRCKELVEECAAVGGANDRREMGTSLHSITALVDQGHVPAHLTAETERDVQAYKTGLAAHLIDMDPDCIELTVVLDDWQVAGTLDRIVHLPGFERPMIADLKTGADLKYSWQSIAVQLAIYSRADFSYKQGEATDGSQDVRTIMPQVDQKYGLVMWLAAEKGELQLYLVDLEAGWMAFEISMGIRDWRKRKDLARPLDDSHLSGTKPAELGDQLAASVKQWLRDRVQRIAKNPPAKDHFAHHWPTGLPPLQSDHQHTAAEFAVIEKLCDDTERAYQLEFPAERPDAADKSSNVHDLFPNQ